jgi:putative two-component system response regulator
MEDSDARRKPRIIMVDDEPDFLAVTKPWLLRDYDVATFGTGENLHEILPALKPDLVLLDVWLPGPDGFEVCRQLLGRERYGRLPVLFLTACADGALHARGRAAGGARILSKPVGRPELLATIEQALFEAELYRRDRGV